MDFRVLRFFIFIGLIGLGGVAKSQHYASMLKQPATWYVTFCGQSTCFTDFYSSEGDTIINGKRYRFMVDFHFNRAVVVREDTLRGKVYFRYLYGQRKHTDVLMYDYSLKLNDSIYIFNPNSPIPEDSLGQYDVVRVDSVLTEKGYRKRLKLDRHDQTSNEYLTTTWVEGIGGLSYINTPAVGPELYGLGELSCFTFNGTSQVYSSDFSKKNNNCNINFTQKDETIGLTEVGKFDVKIYPNPTTKYINISGLAETMIRVEVQDYLGRTIFEKNDNSKIIDFSLVKSGIYVVSIFEGNELINRHRVIKK